MKSKSLKTLTPDAVAEFRARVVDLGRLTMKRIGKSQAAGSHFSRETKALCETFTAAVYLFLSLPREWQDSAFELNEGAEAAKEQHLSMNRRHNKRQSQTLKAIDAFIEVTRLATETGQAEDQSQRSSSAQLESNGEQNVETGPQVDSSHSVNDTPTCRAMVIDDNKGVSYE